MAQEPLFHVAELLFIPFLGSGTTELCYFAVLTRLSLVQTPYSARLHTHPCPGRKCDRWVSLPPAVGGGTRLRLLRGPGDGSEVRPEKAGLRVTQQCQRAWVPGAHLCSPEPRPLCRRGSGHVCVLRWCPRTRCVLWGSGRDTPRVPLGGGGLRLRPSIRSDACGGRGPRPPPSQAQPSGDHCALSPQCWPGRQRGDPVHVGVRSGLSARAWEGPSGCVALPDSS